MLDPSTMSDSRLTRVLLWGSRGLGGLLIFMVAFEYILFLRAGKVPPGHPWSGLSLTMIGSILFFPLSSPKRYLRWARWVVIVFSLVFSLIWWYTYGK